MEPRNQRHQRKRVLRVLPFKRVLEHKLLGTPIRRWIVRAAAATAIVLVALSGYWTIRHAWAIYKLNRGVGDTVFYDADDRPWFRLDEQRQDVQSNQISTFFKDAVIAVEDHRYYLHPGIDPIGLTRALFRNIKGERQGGSTITQQLARTLFLSNSKTYGRKAKEAVLSVMLEIFLSKREILQLYMNRIYLGSGIYGVEAMSRRTFGKPAADLTLGEAALLAGVIRGTDSSMHVPEASSCCAACARKGRSRPRRKKRRGARRCAFDQPHRRRTAAIDTQRNSCDSSSGS
jgi:membrane peptidoglycan carboxypeptidase